MKSGKEVKKKINVLEAMHYIMAAGHKYQSDGNEVANDDDFGQDWEELCRAQRYDFQSYVFSGSPCGKKC